MDESGFAEPSNRRRNFLIQLLQYGVVGRNQEAPAPAGIVPFLLDFEADVDGDIAGKDGFVKSESYTNGSIEVTTTSPIVGLKSAYATTQSGYRTIYHRPFETPIAAGMAHTFTLKAKVNTPGFGTQSWLSVAAINGVDNGVSAPINDPSAVWGLLFTNGTPAPNLLTVLRAEGAQNVSVDFSTVKTITIQVDAAGAIVASVDGAPVSSGTIVAANLPATRLTVMAFVNNSLTKFGGLDNIQLAP